MCGIVGYIGQKPAAPLLLEGLKKLEYRGYDSAGAALLDARGLAVSKAKGRLAVLAERMNAGRDYPQTVGIGHTRWATHGRPSDENSHPHVSEHGRFAVVHNGIIENYQALKAELLSDGVRFSSETDTEVIAQLLERYDDGDLLSTVRAVTSRLEGSYALGILRADLPDTLCAVRRASPLIVGLAPDGNFIASDIPAILAHTRRVMTLADGDCALLTADRVRVVDAAGNVVERPVRTVDWDVAAAEKNGYAHFMLKEIFEQPVALAATISPRINDKGELDLGIRFAPEELDRLRRIVIVACGSAYHAGVAGRYFLESVLKIPVEAELASEFRYRDPLVDDRTLVIIISQSGETADTLAALREAKARGARVLSIVNVVGSTIAVESDDVQYTWAGPEIAVATTKGYTTQVCMLYLLGIGLGTQSGRLSPEAAGRLLSQVRELPRIAEACLGRQDAARRAAAFFEGAEHVYFIGRNLDYAVALEASLKLKEISYIHSEAYAAGELKHGTISLIEEGTPVVALACHVPLIDKTKSNIKEVKARGARVLVVTDVSHAQAFPEADEVLTVPDAPEMLRAIPEVIPMQLLAYHIALGRGCDIDKPRNLAKSVTVE